MKFAVITFPGTGCEQETARAIREVAKEEATIVWHRDGGLDAYDAIVIPSGAAYGDYLRPGALAKSSPIAKEIIAFAKAGKPVIGFGNGFHILVELGLLDGGFVMNPSLKFQSGTTQVRIVNDETFATSLYEKDEVLTIPYATQYGTYVLDEETLQTYKENNQIVMTYEENEWNSTASIAAVTNESGNVFGMMPLAERAVETMLGSTDGVRLFESIAKNGSEQ